METTDKLFLVFGASAVGKTTLVKELARDKLLYLGFDLDAEIIKRFGEQEEEVVSYFHRVGLVEFQKKAFEVINDIRKNQTQDGKIILIDVGTGATYGGDAHMFPKEYMSILLTADAHYLWNNREKARANHSDYEHYQMWQFDMQKILHQECQIKIDVGYLDIIGVKATVHRKINGYLNNQSWK